MDQPTFRIFGLDTTFDHSNATGSFSPSSPLLATGSTPRRRASHQRGSGEKRVSVRLADLLPVLMEAASENRQWLKDFDEDRIEVPQDLYEVAIAYQSMRRAA